MHDVKHFFHCDEPEQQFESGVKEEGTMAVVLEVVIPADTET